MTSEECEEAEPIGERYHPPLIMATDASGRVTGAYVDGKWMERNPGKAAFWLRWALEESAQRNAKKDQIERKHDWEKAPASAEWVCPKCGRPTPCPGHKSKKKKGKTGGRRRKGGSTKPDPA